MGNYYRSPNGDPSIQQISTNIHSIASHYHLSHFHLIIAGDFNIHSPSLCSTNCGVCGQQWPSAHQTMWRQLRTLCDDFNLRILNSGLGPTRGNALLNLVLISDELFQLYHDCHLMTPPWDDHRLIVSEIMPQKQVHQKHLHSNYVQLWNYKNWNF